MTPVSAGVIIALGLLSGALQSWFAGRAAYRFSQRTAALFSAGAMCGGALLASTGRFELIAAGALLGGFNVSNQEIGPFAAIEQVALTAKGSRVHRLAVYNAIGTAAISIGALVGGEMTGAAAFGLYAAAAAALYFVYALAAFPGRERVSAHTGAPAESSGIAERLAGIFAIDAFAGGFVVQGFITYWLLRQFHPAPYVLGSVIAAANVLAALSLFFAVRLAHRIGLVRTMVYTHLPSNVLLAAIPLAPSFAVAAALLLARSALSQMDVPTRQALVLEAVPEHERIHAAGVTNAVRPAAAAASPALAGIAAQTAAFGLPFFIAGTIKSAYDVIVYCAFRRVEDAKSDRTARAPRRIGAAR